MSFPAYEFYQDSGVDWLGEVPSHWEVAAIKHIVSTPVTDGPHETPEFIDEGIPFVSAEAVSSGQIDFAKIRGFISQEDHKRYCQKYKPELGDIYMVKSGASTGTTAIVDDDHEFSIWSPLAAIRCDEDSDPRFVLNYFRSRNFQEGVSLNWSFGTQQNIGMNVIENLQITRPPLDEQKAISSFLDVETSKIDGLVSEQRRLIELLKEKRQAVISHAVTKGLNPNAPMKPSGIQWLGDVPQHWSVTRLSYFATIENGSTPSRDNLDYWENGTVPWVSSGEVNQYRVNQPSELITEQALVDCPVRLLPKGTVVVGMIGQGKTRGLAAILDIEATINQNLAAIVPGDKLKSAYLHFIFQSIYVFLREFGRGGNQAALNCQILGAMTIPVPPVEEQADICDYVEEQLEKFDQLQAEAERAIELLQERRTALISAAVTGKIDVRETQNPAVI